MSTCPEQIELDPVEIDSRPCEFCGLTIDRHELTLPELERRTELIREIEVAAILARMDAMDAMDAMDGPPNVRAPARAEPYRPADSTIAAFLFVARTYNAEYVARWLSEHPLDLPSLLKLLEQK
jgi:hypothetical protein